MLNERQSMEQVPISDCVWHILARWVWFPLRLFASTFLMLTPPLALTVLPIAFPVVATVCHC